MIYGNIARQEKVTGHDRAARSIEVVRYPVKGLHGLAIAQAWCYGGEGMPLDRVYAIENVTVPNPTASGFRRHISCSSCAMSGLQASR